MNDENQTPYDILCVNESASMYDIKAAYRRLRGMFHPDRHNGDEAKAETFRRVQWAFELIGTEEARAKYDAEGYDDPSVPNVEHDAAKLTAELISQALDRNDCLPCMLPRKLDDTFYAIEERARTEAGSFRTELANLEGFRKIIEPDKNILGGFGHRQAILQQGLQQAEHALLVIERAREMVAEFRFKKEG